MLFSLVFIKCKHLLFILMFDIISLNNYNNLGLFSLIEHVCYITKDRLIVYRSFLIKV